MHLKLSVLRDLQLRHGNYTDTDMEIYEEIHTFYEELRKNYSRSTLEKGLLHLANCKPSVAGPYF